MKTRTLTVFVVRHGERLDEALWWNGQHIPHEIGLDPPLTAQGHQQAQNAFARLAQGLRDKDSPLATRKKRKVALFASPTKRTIGTALMVATSGMNHPQYVEWGLQQPCQTQQRQEQQQQQQQEDATRDTMSDQDSTVNDETSTPKALPIVPITVLNGLGSCASAIARRGGAEAVAQAGQLLCADFDLNDGSPDCPASQELQKIQLNCHQIEPPPNTTRLQDKYDDDTQTTTSDSFVQYWRIERTTGRMLPLSPPVSPRLAWKEPTFAMNPKQQQQGKEDEGEAVRVVSPHCLPQKTRKKYGGETFLEALDRAVLLAESDGCDTIVVVAHREGVRDLLDKWGTQGHRFPHRLNYCCIASFVVQTYQDDFDDDRHRSCCWFYEGVVDYPLFSEKCVPSNHD